MRGEYVPTKFVWLMDNVELVGIVHFISPPSENAMGTHGDDLAIIPDANYEHLIRYFRGNQPLPWSRLSEPGVMHLETYPLDRGEINRDLFLSAWQGDARWTLPKKPNGEAFTVINRDGIRRDLQVGDHVRVTGRWVIDHHPEYCKWPEEWDPPESTRCRNRGWLRVGRTHTELHPFDWRSIRLVEPLRRGDISQCTVSMAAPLYEEQYVGDWKHVANELAGVAGHVFIDETNYNTAVGTRIHIDAPPLPAIPASSYRRVAWNEAVYKLGQGMRLNDVRTVSAAKDSIDVQVSVIARIEGGRPFGGIRSSFQPTIHGPAQNRWIFQAEYDVYWVLAGSEISCIRRIPADGELFGVGGQFPSGDKWWLRIEDAVTAARNGHNFYIQPPLGIVLAL